MPASNKSKPTEQRIEYKRLDKNRVLVIAHRSGKKSLKTIVEVFTPEELEAPQEAPAPQNK